MGQNSVTPHYMGSEDKPKDMRPKSSGLLISSSTSALHRVKYTPKSAAKQSIELKSSSEITPRPVLMANNPLSKSLVLVEPKRPLNYVENEKSSEGGPVNNV